jgi:uncharacterized sulfatase
MIEWFDETVGALLSRLDEMKLADNTLVVYVCDNGWIQDPNMDAFAPRSKRSPYDGGIRTPILLRWPGRIRPEEKSNLAHSIDLAPTIIKAAGIKPSSKLPGVDLLDPKAASRRKSIFGAIFSHNAADIDDPAANLEYRWMITKSRKLILPADAGFRPELYDLAADPNETNDLSSAEPDSIVRMTKQIEQWWPARRKKPVRSTSPNSQPSISHARL